MIGANGSSDGPPVEVVKTRPRKRGCLDPATMAETILRGLKKHGYSPGSIAAITARLPASRTSAQRALAAIGDDGEEDAA